MINCYPNKIKVYNPRHVLKVRHHYDDITRMLLKNKIHGSMLVYRRSLEIEKLLSMGLLTRDEYMSWKKYNRIT
jgi:hypothetical protein